MTTTTKTKAPTLQELATSIQAWQRRTFKNASPGSAVEHLRRETVELWKEVWLGEVEGGLLKEKELADIDVAKAADECADIQFMLFQIEQCLGFSLRDAVAAKYRRNLKKLKFIFIDCGTRDEFQLHHGARILSAKLKKMGVKSWA